MWTDKGRGGTRKLRKFGAGFSSVSCEECARHRPERSADVSGCLLFVSPSTETTCPVTWPGHRARNDGHVQEQSTTPYLHDFHPHHNSSIVTNNARQQTSPKKRVRTKMPSIRIVPEFISDKMTMRVAACAATSALSPRMCRTPCLCSPAPTTPPTPPGPGGGRGRRTRGG